MTPAGFRDRLVALSEAEEALAAAFRLVGQGHAHDPDVRVMCDRLAGWSHRLVAQVRPVVDRYAGSGPRLVRLPVTGPTAARRGGSGLLRDLEELYLLATYVERGWQMVGEAGQALRDHELVGVAQEAHQRTQRQLAWLRTRMQAAAPEALLTR